MPIMDRAELVEKLVTTLHLNVAERKMLGAEPVRQAEITSAVMRVLNSVGKFPPNAEPAQPRQTLFEGHFLQTLPDGIVRLWLQRHHPTNPLELAAQKHEDFSDKKEAVHEFVTREWQYGQIDGIPILP
jgi:hypothetical protein